MGKNQIANLTLSVNHEALRSVIASGKLLEFTDTVAKQAAAQISSQLVQHVAEARLTPEDLGSSVGASVEYHFVLGDGEPGYGTVPRPPHWGVVALDREENAGLRQVATEAEG